MFKTVSDTPTQTDGPCSVCGCDTVYAPSQPDMCYDCAVKDAEAGCADALVMAANLQKYGTIDKPKT